jgi:DNA-binding NarL/FixJ family response regulator
MFNTLVVEDNATFRQILLNLLRYRFPFMGIDEAESGDDALEKIKARLPNLVFLDIRLPGENGLELTRKIKSAYPDTIIIILTNYDLPEYRQAANQYGANYFLSKSEASTADDVLKIVTSVVSNAESTEGSRNEVNEYCDKHGGVPDVPPDLETIS